MQGLEMQNEVDPNNKIDEIKLLIYKYSEPAVYKFINKLIEQMISV